MVPTLLVDLMGLIVYSCVDPCIEDCFGYHDIEGFLEWCLSQASIVFIPLNPNCIYRKDNFLRAPH